MHLLLLLECTIVNFVMVASGMDITGDVYHKTDHVMLQTTFQSTANISRVQCCFLCSATSTCESVTYKSSTEECCLSTTSAAAVTTDSVVDDDWVVYSKSTGILSFLRFSHCLNVTTTRLSAVCLRYCLLHNYVK